MIFLLVLCNYKDSPYGRNLQLSSALPHTAATYNFGYRMPVPAFGFSVNSQRLEFNYEPIAFQNLSCPLGGRIC